jgi:hypothetical protein
VKAKYIVIGVEVAVLAIFVFGAGYAVGFLRGYKQAQKQETQFMLPVSFRTYKALQNGDTNRAIYLSGGLLSTYTEKYDLLFPTGSESTRFKSWLPEARQIGQNVRSNILHDAFETNAVR